MKKLKTKIIVISLIATLLIISITTIIIATISKTSTRGQLEVSSAEITATTEYSSTSSSFAWQYNEAGEKKDISIKTTNSTDVVLHNQYNISVNGTADTNLLKAILVYYNGEFVASLSDVINNNIDIESAYSFIPLSNYKTDLFEFELHEAADGSIFDNKEINITITTYSQNADYYNYIFVRNENEFKLAVDDINSGLFEETPSIVLCNTINLSNSYTLEEPTKIYMNGAILSGALTINDTDSESPNALLEILGNGTFNATVTLGNNYDVDGAKELVINHVKELLKEDSLTGTQKNIIGYYSFYSPTVVAKDNCTFSTPDLVMPTSSNALYSKIGKVQVYTTNIPFKIIGSKTELLTSTLAYMPADGATITSDLFLPTYIPSQNANITWKSSDESIITSTGMITADRLENAEVTLYAEIKVNETIITRRYNFKVSAHNNEINFYKLVQEISPVVINNVRNAAEDDGDALYHLPIVSQNNNGTFNNYDYRTSYKSPSNTEMFDWKAYKDIGLENITYSMTQQQENSYDYITLGNTNELYLNTITLNNFAQITITGDFGNNETYSTNINISISVGSNTQLLEKAFTQVSEELVNISVLGNILSTRISDGMKNEKGDFSLSHAYLDTTTNTINEDYTIEFSGTSDIIPSITYNEDTDKYDFKINPEYFNEYETTVAFTATVYYLKGGTGETSKSRTFYVTVPAALHKDDFGTISIYNSTKYQVFSQLPSNEKAHTTGYTVGTTLTDENLDYILLRDIVGDANYLTQYDKSNGLYLEKINYTSSNYAKGTETLSYQTASTNPTSTTDTAAYDFARLIEWATGNTRALASSIVTNTSALGSYASNKANAEDYLNDDEIKVLKEYYCSTTGATESEWNSLYSEVFNVAPGYVYTNPALLNAVVAALNSNGISFQTGTTNYSSLFGKYMEIIQRYAVSTTKVNSHDVAPCQEQYNTTYLWYHSSESGLTSFTAVASNGRTYTSTVDMTYALKDGTYWYRGSRPANSPGRGANDGDYGGFYATSAYAADRTSYITAAEYQVLMMFWLNVCAENLTTSITYDNTTKIQTALTNNAEYYSKYGISDFNTVGETLINAFAACLEIPTYFATDGIAKIIKSFYDKVDYKLTSYGDTNTTPFVSSIYNDNTLKTDIPYITNADNIKSVLSYFTNLKTLDFKGNANLAVFLSENGLSTVFARTGLYNKEITNLTMKHVAHTSVNFDLTNIKNFTKLTTLDLSYNSGIQSVNELVNVNRGNYTSVNIEKIGVEYEYQAFAIDNIASPTCTVRYTDAVGTNTYSNDGSKSSDLADLSDFNKFITQYMYMTNVIYNDDGTTSTVTWRIDEGNEIGSSRITSGGNYPEISSYDEMYELISPYYYCNSGFNYTLGNTNYTFETGYVYKIYCENGKLKRSVLGGPYQSVDDISDLEDYIDTSIPDMSSHVYQENTINESSEITDAGTESVTNYTSFYNSNKYNTTFNDTFTYRFYENTKLTNYKDGVTEYTLPKENNILSYINTNYSSYSNKTINSYSVKVIVTSYNYNSYNSASYGDAWQHSLFLNGTGQSNRIDYSPEVVYGQGTYEFNSFNLTSTYYGKKVYIRYTTVPKDIEKSSLKNTSTYLFPNRTDNASNQRQSFLYIDLEITVNITCDASSVTTVNYKDGTNENFTGYYSTGYLIKKYENVNITYLKEESTIVDYDSGTGTFAIYTGDDTTVYNSNGDLIDLKNNTLISIVPLYYYPSESRTLEYQVIGTIYTWEFYYIYSSYDYNNFISDPYNYDFDSSYSFAGTVDGSLISSMVYATSSGNQVVLASTIRASLPGYSASIDELNYYLPIGTYNVVEISGFDLDWSTPLTSEWVFDMASANPYISYVKTVNSSSLTSLDTQVNCYNIILEDIDYIVRYTGTTGSSQIYVENLSPTTGDTYTNSYGYSLSISNNQLAWNFNSYYLDTPWDTTMDSLLATANQHFNDYQYGEYYGKYYGYSGNNLYTDTGYYYETGYIYRIMPNESNTAFTWVKVSTFVTDTSANILQSLGTGGLSVGSICYSTATSGFGFFYGDVWYKVVLDEKTNIVNLVRFNDLGFTTNGEKTYTQLTNDKLVPRSNDYLGFSGTFTVKISAMIRTYNSTTGTWTEYIKTYKLKFVGSLTS